MKIGVWNIDHPEVVERATSKKARLEGILHYLQDVACDMYVLTEANSAISLAGLHSLFSAESPFLRKSRSYEPPNQYRQVAIYSRLAITRRKIPEPINGVLCEVSNSSFIDCVYGNVITIKDQWKKDSPFKYSNRVDQQIGIMKNLPDEKMLIAGDFNLKLGWAQKDKAYKAVEGLVDSKGWCWPTRTQTDSVQHVLHTNDIKLDFHSDHNVKDELKYSDHPFITLNIH